MAPSKKPAILKTFSEFTINELRSMPLRRVLTLFFQEMNETFFTSLQPPEVKRKKVSKKKPARHILTAKIRHPRLRPNSFRLPFTLSAVKTTGFTQAMKRVFTVGPVREYEQAESVSPKKAVSVTAEEEKSEPKHEGTVVFSTTPSPVSNQ